SPAWLALVLAAETALLSVLVDARPFLDRHPILGHAGDASAVGIAALAAMWMLGSFHQLHLIARESAPPKNRPLRSLAHAGIYLAFVCATLFMFGDSERDAGIGLAAGWFLLGAASLISLAAIAVSLEALRKMVSATRLALGTALFAGAGAWLLAAT